MWRIRRNKPTRQNRRDTTATRQNRRRRRWRTPDTTNRACKQSTAATKGAAKWRIKRAARPTNRRGIESANATDSKTPREWRVDWRALYRVDLPKYNIFLNTTFFQKWLFCSRCDWWSTYVSYLIDCKVRAIAKFWKNISLHFEKLIFFWIFFFFVMCRDWRCDV